MHNLQININSLVVLGFRLQKVHVLTNDECLKYYLHPYNMANQLDLILQRNYSYVRDNVGRAHTSLIGN